MATTDQPTRCRARHQTPGVAQHDLHRILAPLATALSGRLSMFVAIMTTSLLATVASAQQVGIDNLGAEFAQDQDMLYEIGDQSNRVPIVVGSSRVLTFEYDVPRFVVGNSDVIRATPVTPNQIMISGLQQGVSPLGVYDADGNIQTLDVHVTGDVRSLQIALEQLFPEANIRAHALNASVILTGYVPNSQMMSQAVRVAEDFFPTPINHLTVGGSQTVLLNVRIIEVSRTKLRRLGIDWAVLTGNDFFIQSVNNLIDAAAAQTGQLRGAGTLQFGVINNGNQFGMFIDALEQNNMAKILDEPILVTTSGRPASLRSGGEVPIPVNNGLGTVTVEFREFGTLLDFVPLALGNGALRLEINSDVIEIAGDLRDPVTGVPGFRNRGVNTGVTMRAGQTLALAGIIQNRRDSEVQGIPYLVDLPYIGTFFRGVEDTFNEVELVIMVTPQFIGPVDADQYFNEGPGSSTVAPNNRDFFFRGYQEVPRCNNPLELGPVIPFQGGGYYPGADGMIEPLPPAGDPSAVPPIGSEGGVLDLPPTPADGSDSARYLRSGHHGQYPVVSGANRRGSRYDPYQRQNVELLPPNSRGSNENSMPQFIGRTGYDVIK